LVLELLYVEGAMCLVSEVCKEIIYFQVLVFILVYLSTTTRSHVDKHETELQCKRRIKKTILRIYGSSQ